MPNKPTTLREKIYEILKWSFEVSNERNIAEHKLNELLISHSTELISKIEGLRLEIDPLSVNKRGHHTNGAHRKIRYNRALDDVIKLINQE